VELRLRNTVRNEEVERAQRSGFTIEDEGARVAISFDGERRLLNDPSRRCPERADWAAVQLALHFRSPRPSPAPALSAVEQPPAVNAESAPAPRLNAPWMHAAASTRLGIQGGGLASKSAGLDLGLAVPMAFLPGELELIGAVTLETPSVLPAQGVTAHMWRLPLRIGVRRGVGSGALRAALALSAELALLRLMGSGIEEEISAVRIDQGIRLDVVMEYRFTPRWAVQATLAGVLFPWPYTLVVEPQGPVGTTPPLGMGLNLGIAHRIGD
jgi:hypothetical protein